MYRSEHPKPQFMRENWRNLNGEWDFELDLGDSGVHREMYAENASFTQKIQVPFCPQSKLSGIEYKDFMAAVWYRRSFALSACELENLVYLHFGAVDYYAEIFVNGKKCGEHKGGYVSFKVNITDFVTEGENILTVCAHDNERDRLIPSGKQCRKYASQGCSYTRTTGIWQTVWLEFVPKTHIEKFKLYPDATSGKVSILADITGSGTFTAKAGFEGREMGSASAEVSNGQIMLTVDLAEKHLWEIGVGGLYDLELSFGSDLVKSYFGLRTIDYSDKKFRFNGRSVFQRLILDQGFYPDGVYTAPSDAELEADVDRSMAMGFNGARLHEKVFEERFLYHADKKGYLIWGEYPNWGLDHTYADAIYGILPEWLEEIERDFNHPSIIGWCPFNETWNIEGRKQFDPLLGLVYAATKAADPTRPCIDSSGTVHIATDICDFHDYEQNPAALKEFFKDLGPGKVLDFCGRLQAYDGKLPFFVSEYGGIRWSDDASGWGYGNSPRSEEEFLTRLKDLTDVLLDDERIFAFCYTQLTDVEQEQNGLYTYDRKAKFPPELIAPIFTRKAAIED
ncbi:MAG: beta-galactosidase [Clostridia bacterium]|nr:beta-galactosidase [Clostridia bacterium]